MNLNLSLNTVKDSMTPIERQTAYFNGQEVDRLPCVPMMSDDVSKYIGKKVNEFLFDSNVMVETELYKVREMGFDSASVYFGLKGIGECLGSEFEYPNERASFVTDPILKDYSMLEHINLINPYRDGRAPIILEAVSILRERLDGYCTVGSDVPGPLSAAHAVRGSENLLKDIVKNPDGFSRLLDFMVACGLEWVKAMYETNGIVCSISDPLCSTIVIGQNIFREKIFSHLNNLVEGIIAITGEKPALHICGKTKDIWPDLLKLNISALSPDNLEDMGEAKEFLGKKLLLIGNVDPVNTIVYGSKEDIFLETLDCIKKASDSPNGYFVGSGCAIPRQASKENVIALIDATRYYTQGFKLGMKYQENKLEEKL